MRWPELLTAHIKIQEAWVRAEGCEDKGGGFCRYMYTGAFGLSTHLLTLAGIVETKRKEGQAVLTTQCTRLG
jgi:hypothetical protein